MARDPIQNRKTKKLNGVQRERANVANGEKGTQQTIQLLKKEMQTLQEELSMFQKDKWKSKIHQAKDYHTDEEELSPETD